MAIILLVRHGENDYVKKGRLAGRLPGVHLNKTGKKQAKALAKKFANTKVKVVYSSPLERTLETAQPIAKALGLDIISHNGLLEVDFGKWQDKKLEDLRQKKLWRVVQTAPSHMSFPGGESFAQAQHRICQALDGMVKKHKQDDILICVSHSDIIKLAVAYFTGIPLDLFQRLHVSPASITAMQLGEAGARLLNLNYDISFTLPSR